MESRAKLVGHAIHPMLIVFPLGLLGMPKAPTAMSFDERDGVIESRAGGSFVRARPLPGGRALGRLAAAALPV